MKKVLGIVSSPRRTGNSEILVKEMLSVLPAEVERKLINVTTMRFEECTACYACLPEGCKCVIKDDLETFLEQILWADAVIIGAPCYFLGMHTTLKKIGDRMISVLREGKRFSGRKCVVAVPYGIEGWDGIGLEATVNFARFLHLDVVGRMSVNAANPGEVATPEVIAQVRELAMKLLSEKPANLATANADALCCPVCGSGVFRLLREGSACCPSCGATGRIRNDAGKISLDFHAEEPIRFSLEGMEEHGARLEATKERYMADRQRLAELRRKYRDMS